jgi:flagellar FliL protein
MSKAPEKKAEPEAGAPVVKSKKKLIIMVSAAVLILGVVGGGAAILLSKKNSGAKDKEQKVEPAKPSVFVPLEAFVVNLQSESGDKFLQVNMTLQVPDEEQASLIKLNMPQVRSRLLMLLSSKEASEILTAEGKEKLVEDIVTQVKLPFVAKGTPQKVTGVFFTSFIVQ